MESYKSALGRAEAALTKLEAAVTAKLDVAGTEALETSLENEKAANAQLEARLQSVQDKSNVTITQLEQRVERLQDRLTAAEAQVQALSMSGDTLRDNNAKLRSANAAMSADPNVISSSVSAELDGLRAARAADLAEMNAILSEMKPLVGEA